MAKKMPPKKMAMVKEPMAESKADKMMKPAPKGFVPFKKKK